MGSAKVCLRGQQKVLVGNTEVSQMWHFKDFRRKKRDTVIWAVKDFG